MGVVIEWVWLFAGTNDTAKVEVWDVVDYGRSAKKKKNANASLKMSNDQSVDDMALDASSIDVYKGAHAVILVYDITKQWTWEYVEREINNVPFHIPVVVLGNYCDMQQHRTVSRDDAEFYVTHLNRPDGAADIRYNESCMRNGFGLRFLHKFLSIPFLYLQQESLLHQLKSNREQIMVVNDELNGSVEQDYDNFVNDKAKPPIAPKEVTKKSEEVGIEERESPDGLVEDTPTVDTPPGADPPRSEASLARRITSKFSSFMSSKTKSSPLPSPEIPAGASSIGDVDDFVPDDKLDDGFFNDEGAYNGRGHVEEESSEDDEDEENPQVAIDEDLSSPDEPTPPPVLKMKKTPPTTTKTPPTTMKPQPTTVKNPPTSTKAPPVTTPPISSKVSSVVNKASPITKAPPTVQQELTSEEEEEESSDDDDEPRPGVMMDEEDFSEPNDVPVKPAVVKKATPILSRPLVSARDVVLTESDSEEEEEEETRPTRNKPETNTQSNKQPKTLLLTHHQPSPTSKNTTTSSTKGTTGNTTGGSTKASGGLLIDFDDLGSTPPAGREKKVKKHSPDKARKKKKRVKGSVNDDVGGNKEMMTSTGPVSDPFDFSSTLDAWLDGDNVSTTPMPRPSHLFPSSLLYLSQKILLLTQHGHLVK
jgi:hypothetical protein